MDLMGAIVVRAQRPQRCWVPRSDREAKQWQEDRSQAKGLPALACTSNEVQEVGESLSQDG